MARSSLWLCLLASISSVLVSAQAPRLGLHDLAVAAGFEFWGTATDTNRFNDTAYMTLLNNIGEFGLIVPENSQKWEAIQPTENDFEFANPDRVAALARANGQLLRCHTLTWHSQLPAFVENGTWTRETLTAAIETHIANVVGHFRGLCTHWDVVNEALEDNGTFRNSVFFRTLGTDFLPISFNAAAEADPDAKLYYNDFNLEYNGNKTDSAVAIAKLVQESGARIDGVGFQAHLIVGQTPALQTLTTVLNRFTSLGLEVLYTELDIRHTSLPANTSAVQQQARDYVTVVQSCLDVAACVGVIVWQFVDKYSWIPDTFPGAGDACMFTSNFTRKPAYASVSSLLAAAAATNTAQVGGGRDNLNVGGGFGAASAGEGGSPAPAAITPSPAASEDGSPSSASAAGAGSAAAAGPAVEIAAAASGAERGGFLRGRGWHGLTRRRHR